MASLIIHALNTPYIIQYEKIKPLGSGLLLLLRVNQAQSIDIFKMSQIPGRQGLVMNQDSSGENHIL